MLKYLIVACLTLVLITCAPASDLKPESEKTNEIKARTIEISARTRETPPNFKVAFIGDAGISTSAKAVLNLIRDEDADMVLHQGDLWYDSESDPQLVIDFERQVNDVLGEDFPYFASIGNHDVELWPFYQEELKARISRIPGAQCVSEGNGLGVKSSCTYAGLSFLLLGPGTLDSGFDTYIRNELARSDSIWRICSWHKNQRSLQIGGRSSQVGWAPYERCREGSAIIATGHEHSYERTKTLTRMESKTVDAIWSGADDLRVGNGSSFVFVSGLGGASARSQQRCFPEIPPFGCSGEWASIYTSLQNATQGALFIEFNVDGDPRKATGYFKSVDQVIIDTFSVTADVSN